MANSPSICSLLPSATEILFAMGLGDHICGLTDLCDYPPEACDKRVVCRSKIDPSVMSSQEVEEAMRRILESGESPYDLDEEWLRGNPPLLIQEWLRGNPPDVVLTQDLCYFCEVDAATVGRAVKPMPVQPEVLVLNPRTVEEIFDSICDVGRACGVEGAAQRLAAEMRSGVEAVEAAVSAAVHRPRVYSLEGINPLVIGGHWIPDMLLRAGGRQELYEPGCPAGRIDWQEVLDYAPEKLFIDLCSSDLGRHMREVSWLGEQKGWWEIPAVKAGEVYLIDHVFFSRPGPRIVKGLEMLAELIHPGLFSGSILPGTVAKLEPGWGERLRGRELADCFRPFPN